MALLLLAPHLPGSLLARHPTRLAPLPFPAATPEPHPPAPSDFPQDTETRSHSPRLLPMGLRPLSVTPPSGSELKKPRTQPRASPCEDPPGRCFPGPPGLTPSHGSPRPLRRNPCSTSRAPALLPQPGPFLLSPLGPPQPTRPQSGPHLGLPAFLGTPVTSQALPCRAPQLTARRPSTHVFGPLKSGVSGRGACALPPYAHTHCPAPSAAPAWTLTWHLLTSTLPPLIWHLAPALSMAVPTIAEQSLDN